MSVIYQRSPHTAFVMGIDHEGVENDISYVANLLTSEIAVLQGPSAVIWDILESPSATEAIFDEITNLYGVPQETVAESVLTFLDSLKEQGLVVAGTQKEEA